MLRDRMARALSGAALILPAPVLAGDWPDPSVIRADGEQVMVSTSGGWAPTLRVLKSPDLRTWRISNSVFRRPPGWVKTNFWAPEIFKLRSGYAIFYSALPKRPKDSWFCLGVATAATTDGPWRDAGRPLRCGKYGSIDPFAVRDENRRLHLLWKEDGNEFKRKTPIFAQPLREDGKKLLGRPKELIRNDRRWERKVVEAPHVIRTGDGFQLFYSANLCCTRRCAYAVGVARATRLLGPWRKFSGNPILRGGNGWRCPGHATFTDDGEGGTMALFHAYRSGEGRVAGRQVLSAPLTFRPDGWPRIGNGRPPASSPGAASTAFSDDFDGPLAAEWEWSLRRPPGIRVAGGLTLRANRGSRARLDAGVLSRRVGTVRYTGSAVVDRDSLRGKAQAGLASYRSGFEAIGLSVGRGTVTVWQRRKGKFRRLASTGTPSGTRTHVRMVARGNRFRFMVSPDGAAWRGVGGSRRGPIEESARFALTTGGTRGAAARFVSAALVED